MFSNRSTPLTIGLTLALACWEPSPADAGPIKWLKDAGEAVLGTKAKKEARELARQRAAREAAEAASKQAARSAGVSYAGRATRAFEVGAYTLTGAVIFNTVLSGYGYASSESSGVDEDVAEEIAVAAGNEERIYVERYCSKPNGEKYIVPAWNSSCGDGSAPRQGNGINLQDVRNVSGS